MERQIIGDISPNSGLSEDYWNAISGRLGLLECNEQLFFDAFKEEGPILKYKERYNKDEYADTEKHMTNVKDKIIELDKLVEILNTIKNPQGITIQDFKRICGDIFKIIYGK